jgi:hypothetical protein
LQARDAILIRFPVNDFIDETGTGVRKFAVSKNER